jgi:transketolase
LRLGKAGEPVLHKGSPSVSPDKWTQVAGEPGSKTVFLSTGAALRYALAFAESIKDQEPEVISVPLWGMRTKSFISDNLTHREKVYVFEDHLFDGGFGSWLLEGSLTSGRIDYEIIPRALSLNVLGRVGDQNYLNKIGGMESEALS